MPSISLCAYFYVYAQYICILLFIISIVQLTKCNQLLQRIYSQFLKQTFYETSWATFLF